MYEPGVAARTSRRTITWAGVVRARERLRAASVRAVVGSSPPPPGAFRRVDRVGAAWVARLDGAPLVEAGRPGARLSYAIGPGEIEVHFKWEIPNLKRAIRDKIFIRETFDPGWKAEVDGVAVAVEPHLGTFLAVAVPDGARRLVLRYDPGEVRLGGSISLAAAAVVFALTGFRPSRSTRILVQGLGRTRAIELESVL
jgi:hypothetical protein